MLNGNLMFPELGILHTFTSFFFSVSGNFYFPEKTKVFFSGVKSRPPICKAMVIFFNHWRWLWFSYCRCNVVDPKIFFRKIHWRIDILMRKLSFWTFLISTSVWNFQFHSTVHFESVLTMHLTSTCTCNSDIFLP